MGIKDIKGTSGASALSPAEIALSAELDASIPVVITEDLFKAALERGGAETQDLHEKLDTCRRRKRCMRDGDVDTLIRRGSRRQGRMDGNQAVVMAYYAQRHRGVFSPESFKRLTKMFSNIEWTALVIELNRFIAELRAKEAEYKKAEQIKKDRLTDDIKRDDNKRQLIKDNGTKADRQRELRKHDAEKVELKERIKDAAPGEIDEELTASGRLQLSDVELTKLGLMKKGFANKG
jgi:hypothetical protein